ncbi:hypothetical protein [Mesorhizobium sp. J428]|uniref:ORC-CDC6 family AAA ATPase n=1 Tax=Mesorhizobium sp. J428 TaxID=2898440 RepID=UPI0021512647|nr:hypothetical protein [Mesorhizobium sp. J428]MCR5857917.1 hypothetical protein [Mesorhizobium sp. J428]
MIKKTPQQNKTAKTGESSGFSDTEILGLLSSLRHRAEKSSDLSAFFPSFVPVIDLDLLSSRNTQVIYGRNGTGKTHILKCFEEICLHNFAKYRVLPVYFDMRMLDISRISPDLTEEDIVESFFSGFLNGCIEQIATFVKQVENIDERHADTWSHLKSQAVQSKFKAAIKRLRKSLDGQRMRERINGYTKSIRTKNETAKQGDAGIALSAVGADAKLSGSASASTSREEFVELVIKASHFIDFAEIREGLDELVEALQVEQIVILIDEWSQIDTSVQPIFSELLRRTIGTSNRISCKIAALKFLTQFTATVKSRRIGLQPGIDITELADLNHIFTFDLDRRAVRHFLLYILIKHLLEEYALSKYDYDFYYDKKIVIGNVTRIFERLFTHIFESADAFDYFVRASEGNPRDFLAMVAECCATHGAAHLPITLRAVQASVISYFTTTKIANFPDASISSLKLFDSIFMKCLSNKSKIFSVSKDIDAASDALKDLWAQRIIHLIDNNYEYFDVDGLKVRSFAIYAVDYGKILGLRSDKKGGEALDGIVNNARHFVSGLYDGLSHKAILEHIETTDSRLSAVSEILGAAPETKSVTDQVDVLSPEVLYQKIVEINVDSIVSAHANEQRQLRDDFTQG